jgi:hypothetical protein
MRLRTCSLSITFSGCADLEKLSRQLERRLVAFGLQALTASILQRASG